MLHGRLGLINYTGGPKSSPKNVPLKKQQIQSPKPSNLPSSPKNVKPLLPDLAAGHSHAHNYSLLKAPLDSMMGQQRQMMQSQLSHQWFAAPRLDKPQWWLSPMSQTNYSH